MYVCSGDPSLPSEHPRNAQVRTVVGSIAYDLLPRGCLLKKLYAFEPLLDLVKGFCATTYICVYELIFVCAF